MKNTVINNQAELDKLKLITSGECVRITASLRLNHVLEVNGTGELVIECSLDCDYYAGRYVHASGNATVHASGNATVRASGNATVHAWGNATVHAWDNATVHAWGNATVHAWDNATVRAMGGAMVKVLSEDCKVSLSGFAVCSTACKTRAKIAIEKSSKAAVHNVGAIDWFDNNGVEKKDKVILYKRVSNDFQTQEGTKDETDWKVGSTVEHKAWDPKSGECGAGKFHACSQPYFCDEFRSGISDRYVAIEIALEDLHEWTDNPSYPHKIGFRKGKVLFECDAFGKEKR